jgi:2-polyprenyl-3-methyl-5-hydroxy-6-metoxy-1,4-benzoquinol methylase
MSDVELARKAYRPMHSWLKRPFLQLLPKTPGAVVLDAGCGSGYMANWLASLGYKVIGIDREPSRIRRARAAFPHVRFEQAAVEDDLEPLLKGQPVDVIVSTDVIEHLYSPGDFLHNAMKHLAGGGSLILSTPYHGYFKNLAISLFNGWDTHFSTGKDGGHIKFFSVKSLGDLMQSCGFTDLKFVCAGRAPLLWKSIVCRGVKPV